ncbi:MAG: PASTA domain-containing protein [Bacteroidota bacterium]
MVICIFSTINNEHFMAKNRLSPLNNRTLRIVAFSIIGVFILFNYALLPWYVNQGGTLVVPTVTGKKLEDAQRILDSLGFEPVQAETRPDPRAPLGTVVSQNPLPEAMVKSGRRVYLTISGGEVLASVPKLRGLSLRDSRFTLERSGLQLGDVAYATSETYPPNTIMAQAIAPGSKVSRGTKVNISVSRGAVALDLAVPELTGKTLGEAENILTEKGLKVGNITYQPSFDLIPNTVVDQFPRAGESVSTGQAVDLFIVGTGKPKEEIQVPNN